MTLTKLENISLRQLSLSALLLMAGCLLIFVAQWPRLSREAFLTGEELSPLLGSTLMAWVFLAPLLLYGIAASLIALLAGWLAAVIFNRR